MEHEKLQKKNESKALAQRPKLDFDPNSQGSPGMSNAEKDANMQYQSVSEDADGEEDDFNYEGAAVLDKSDEKEKRAMD